MKWSDFEEVCAAHELTLPPGSPAGPVVQLEQIDFLADPLSKRLLWMEGRGWDWRAIAEGAAEARNPGADNPLQWPRRYLAQLIHGSRGRRNVRSDFRVERASLFAWLRGTERLPRRPEWLKRGARWQRQPSFALIAEVWAGLTQDWSHFGVPPMTRDEVTLTEWPATVPETLRMIPQAVIAWDEWTRLSNPTAEELDESTVRQHVTEVMRPVLRRLSSPAP